MKPVLCKAGQQLREQFDDTFPDRDRRSDGWLGDQRHSTRPSQHNPDPKTGIVSAIDVDRDVHKSGKPDLMPDIADQLLNERPIPFHGTGWRWDHVPLLRFLGNIAGNLGSNIATLTCLFGIFSHDLRLNRLMMVTILLSHLGGRIRKRIHWMQIFKSLL